MTTTVILGWIGAAVGVIGLFFGGITVRKLIDTTTTADRDRAAERVSQQIREARDDEREKCSERVRRLVDQLKEITSDRDTERTRANALQSLINQQRLRGPDD